MKLLIFVPLAAFLASAFAITADDISEDASPCLNQCLNEAAGTSGCISKVDYECTCSSPAFKDTLTTCLELACTDADAELAGELHKQNCGTDPK